jgi:hypothetical protein
MTLPSKQGRLAIAALVAAGVLAGCGETVTSNGFTGEEHEVAARIASFQKHASETSQKKICSQDLSASLVASIEKSGNGKNCEEALKEQLKNVEDLTLTINDVTVHGKHATATVKSVRYGKTRPSTLTLVKEGQDWKISGV